MDFFFKFHKYVTKSTEVSNLFLLRFFACVKNTFILNLILILIQQCISTVSNSKQTTNDEVKLTTKEYKLELAWFNIAAFIYLHGAAFYGLFGVSKSWSTIICGKYECV